MSKPEVKVTIDKYGHVVYSATDELRERMAEQMEFVLSQTPEALAAENAKLRELLDYALPIAMYAASTEEGDRIRELMRVVDE